MGMAAILLNGVDPYEQIVNILSTERRLYVNHVKSNDNCFKEEDNFIQRAPVSYPSKILKIATVLLL